MDELGVIAGRRRRQVCEARTWLCDLDKDTRAFQLSLLPHT